MTNYLRDAQRAHEAAAAELAAAREAAVVAYERRAAALDALAAARQTLEIARLFPSGPPFVTGDRVAASPGFPAGVIIGVHLGPVGRVGQHRSPEQYVATVRGDDGSLYPVKAARS